MPFDSVPEKDFKNREREIEYLRSFVDSRASAWEVSAMANNVLLEGGRGMGKTELLKFLYRAIFWEEKDIIPFYYRFQSATLRGSYFARDYLSRFVRQLLACLKKDPSFIANMSTPLHRLMPLVSAYTSKHVTDLVLDFQEQILEGDLPSQILAAVSSPIIAADRLGKRLLVMLDDFHLVTQLFDAHPGDTPSMVSLFESSMKTPLCPHILTGSPEGVLEDIFTDDSFRGKAERLFLRPLPEDSAFSMLKEHSIRLGVQVSDKLKGLMRHLGGNPLYIKLLSRAFWKLQRSNVDASAFWECYAHEVSEGETAFYWSSVLRGSVEEPELRRLALELLMQSLLSPLDARDLGRLSRAFGAPEASLREVLGELRVSGMLEAKGNIQPPADGVLRDFIRSLHMLEIEGREPEKAREMVMERHLGPGEPDAVTFEMVIPMVSDAELVAAKAAEQIGAVMKLKEELVNQLQLALIEACINAFEHSGSYEKKVYLRFTVRPERLEIAIESPGRPFQPEGPAVAGKDRQGREQKRGWGLKIMKKLMDEVKVESIADRTRVVLVKKIKPEEVSK